MNQIRARNLISVILVGQVLSLIIQCAGFLTPGWMCLRTKTTNFQRGLFYMVYCRNIGTCVTTGLSASSGYKDPIFTWVDYRAMVIVAFIGALLSTIMIGLYRHQSLKTRYPIGFKVKLVTAILAAIISGALEIAAVGKIGAASIKENDIYRKFDLDLRFTFPYSLFMTAIGGLLALFMACVTLGYLIAEMNEYKAYPGHVVHDNTAYIQTGHELDTQAHVPATQGFGTQTFVQPHSEYEIQTHIQLPEKL